MSTAEVDCFCVGKQRRLKHHRTMQDFAELAVTLYQFLMHDGDLPARTAETDEAELQPEPERFTKTDCARSGQLFFNH